MILPVKIRTQQSVRNEGRILKIKFSSFALALQWKCRSCEKLYKSCKAAGICTTVNESDCQWTETAIAISNGSPTWSQDLIGALPALRDEDSLFTLDCRKRRVLQEQLRSKIREESSGKSWTASALLSNGDESWNRFNSGTRRLKSSHRQKSTNFIRAGHKANRCSCLEGNGWRYSHPIQRRPQVDHGFNPSSLVGDVDISTNESIWLAPWCAWYTFQMDNVVNFT